MKENKEVNTINPEPGWANQIIKYLKSGQLSESKEETRKIRARSSRYLLLGDALYKRSFTLPLLRCLSEEKVDYMLQEIHEGMCGNHSRGRSMVHKAIKVGYYWPSMQKDAALLAQRCDKCQQFANMPRRPTEELTPIVGPWPFAQWKIDIMVPLPKGKVQMRFLVVAIDYFTKWVEAEALVRVTEKNIRDFTWKSIICRFDIP